MAERSASPFTGEQGRRFGLTVGIAFLAFAGIAWWRQHPTMASVLAALGSGLVLGGLVIPRQLGPVERSWMALAHVISKVTTPIVMAVMYIGVLLPVGILRRRFGGNPLVHSQQEGGFWRRRAPGARRSRSMRRQF